jgi:hypothetical protein
VHRRFDRRSYFSTVGSSDATLERGSYLSYPTAASRFVSNPNLSAAAPAPFAAAPLAFGDLHTNVRARASSTGPSVPTAGRRASPPCSIARAAAAAP